MEINDPDNLKQYILKVSKIVGLRDIIYATYHKSDGQIQSESSH